MKYFLLWAYFLLVGECFISGYIRNYNYRRELVASIVEKVHGNILPFKTFTLISGDPHKVDMFCRKGAVKDNGDPIESYDMSNGCAFELERIIVVNYSDPWCTVAHEIAHLDGIKDPETAGMGCRGNR